MRDLPRAADLLALTDAMVRPHDEALAARCRDIAARERLCDQIEYDAVRRALTALYGSGDDAALLEHLAADIRSGRLDRPGPERARVERLLLHLTVQKLKESNPAFLAGTRFA